MRILFLFSIFCAFAQAEYTSFLLMCVPEGNGAKMVRLTDEKVIAQYTSQTECLESKDAANGDVVCVYFTPEMPIGPGGWAETGWRAMNVYTQIGLGRRPFTQRSERLAATQSARGGVVCTNTGVGAKAANIETNMWCGASSQLKYCYEATLAAKHFVVCSFPSDGTGAENGWIRTKVGRDCDYQSSATSLKNCSASIPEND